MKLAQATASARVRAVACHTLVRSLPFACVADGAGTTALQVLASRRGDCHTKGTLMVALLRSLAIPARLRFVTMKADFLHGLADLRGQPIEHACTEVLLEGGWVALDSYVVDPWLALAARAQLRLERRSLGYGMHLEGSTDWDGHGDSFSQFTPDDPDSMPLHDWGVFDDAHQFYSSVPYVRQRLSLTGRLKWRVGAALVNRRVAALREQRPAPAATRGKEAATAATAPSARPGNRPRP